MRTTQNKPATMPTIPAAWHQARKLAMIQESVRFATIQAIRENRPVYLLHKTA